MNNAYVATYLAKALLAEKKERLNTRVNEIAAEKWVLDKLIWPVDWCEEIK